MTDFDRNAAETGHHVPIKRTLANGVLTINLDRAAKKNAITLAMWRHLRNLFREIDADPDVRVVILTGGDQCFSAGADIAEFPQVRSTPDQVWLYEGSVDGALAAITASSKPTIAAISGVCFAGGVALAASTDFRVADATANFSVSAVKIGLVYNVAKCARLHQLVGLTGAKRLLMTGQRFNAESALAMGLLDELVEENALAAANDLAVILGSGAPLAVRGVKSILEALANGTVEARSTELCRQIAAADASEDHREAVKAFSEKRRPVFRGR